MLDCLSARQAVKTYRCFGLYMNCETLTSGPTLSTYLGVQITQDNTTRRERLHLIYLRAYVNFILLFIVFELLIRTAVT